MNEPIAERDALWIEFLARWPREKLPAMQLSEYIGAGNRDTSWGGA
jgi:5-methylcytosine-specific restriction protein B